MYLCRRLYLLEEQLRRITLGTMETHLINEFGDKRVVETRLVEKITKQLNESTGTNYHLDVNWYLNNGYMTIKEARESIENGNN